MNRPAFRTLAVASASFVGGVAVAVAAMSAASQATPTVKPASVEFMVSIDAIQQNLVFGERFSGQYSKSVALSDGSTRSIALSPVMKDGKLLVQFKDSGGDTTFMGPNGTSTNGKLMVQLRQVEAPQ